MGWFGKKKKRELDEYERLCKILGRRPDIDDPTIVHDLLAQGDFEDSTIEKIERAANSDERDKWREDSDAQKEAEREAKREAKRQAKLEARERRTAEAEERRIIREEREARRQEYLQERRDAGHDDDDDSDFVD